MKTKNYFIMITSLFIILITQNVFAGTINKSPANNPFQEWGILYQEAQKAHTTDLNFAALANIDKNGQPELRYMITNIMPNKGFVFYVDANSQMVSQFQQNKKAAILFKWKIAKQVIQIKILGNFESYGKAKTFKTDDGKTVQWLGFIVIPKYFQFGFIDTTKKTVKGQFLHYCNQLTSDHKWVLTRSMLLIPSEIWRMNSIK